MRLNSALAYLVGAIAVGSCAAGGSLLAVSDDRGFAPLAIGAMGFALLLAVLAWQRKWRWLLLAPSCGFVALGLGIWSGEPRSEWVLKRTLPELEPVARECLTSGRCPQPSQVKVPLKWLKLEAGNVWLNPEHHNVMLVRIGSPAGQREIERERCAKPFVENWYIVRRC